MGDRCGMPRLADKLLVLACLTLVAAQSNEASTTVDQMCDDAQRRTVAKCYKHTDEQSCAQGEAARLGCQWCPNFISRVGIRNLCRSTLACFIRVRWDQAPEFLDMQNGCVSEFSAATPSRGRPETLTMMLTLGSIIVHAYSTLS